MRNTLAKPDEGMVIGSPLQVWKKYDQVVGPHPLPMLELRFSEENGSAARDWLALYRGDFSVLIHEDTGNDIQDHEGAEWLGETLPLRVEFFDEILKHPERKVNSDYVAEPKLIGNR